jgi:FkbM family methyltransferase
MRIEFSTGLMNYNVIKHTPNGYILYNQNDQYVGKSIEVYGDYQREETKFFEGYVKEGDTVLDIGANIGTHTLWFANKVGDKGYVLAFEPQRLIFQTLCANMAINSIQNTDCKHMGVGSVQKLIDSPILDPTKPQNFGGFSLEDAREGDKVAICKIDDIGLTSCDFIKIDVEGMEPDVLMGGLNTIAMLRPYIYMEIDRKENTELILEIMAELKYQVEEHNPPIYSPEYSGKNIFGELASLNAICTPGEKYAGPDKSKNTH